MKLMNVIGSMILLLISLAGGSQAPKNSADMVFINAKAYTLDDNRPWVDAIAIKGNTIVYVGGNEGALAFGGDNTVQHDLNGKMLLPGFIDTHMHPIEGGAFANALSLETFGTVGAWVQSIADYAEENSDGLSP